MSYMMFPLCLHHVPTICLLRVLFFLLFVQVRKALNDYETPLLLLHNANTLGHGRGASGNANEGGGGNTRGHLYVPRSDPDAQRRYNL